jgi:hypothetical protein
MSRFLAALLPLAMLFQSTLLLAADEETPVEPANPMIIIGFFAVVVVCFAIYGWLTWRASKKPEEEKLGEKF